jgi:hypothetical protein
MAIDVRSIVTRPPPVRAVALARMTNFPQLAGGNPAEPLESPRQSARREGSAADHLVPGGPAHQTEAPIHERASARRLQRPSLRFDASRRSSTETQWPAYASIAPASSVRRDVTEARAVLNFAEWPRCQPEAKEASEECGGSRSTPAGTGENRGRWR